MLGYQDFGNMQLKLEELGVEARLAELHRLPTTTKVFPILLAEIMALSLYLAPASKNFT